ncbi:hypothetical protein D4764_02G0003100 [Takifugu flavidus]|uniref:PiggyBac transposable element-derived protein domain-containing protein n=1 Tax=Takifugu flavidus TaxID=433684 RepID=A0A5C6NKT9_9TELE|nr:hypothetical protein D4764_02G0003100 [Takifugu flavidus]
MPEWRGGSSASRHPSAQHSMNDEDSESAQNARSDVGTTVEVEEPAGLQGDHLGDHLDLQSECLTRELVEQTATRTTETVLDMEDVGVEENSLNVSIKRKNLQLFQESIKHIMKTGSFGQPSFTDQEIYRLKKLMFLGVIISWLYITRVEDAINEYGHYMDGLLSSSAGERAAKNHGRVAKWFKCMPDID